MVGIVVQQGEDHHVDFDASAGSLYSDAIVRIRATTESVKASEVTVLALIEVLAMGALVVYVAVARDSLAGIAYGACLAPLLLLRTNESTSDAFRWYERGVQWIFSDPLGGSVIANLAHILMFVIYITLGVALIRAASVMYRFGTEPLSSLRAIPENWARQSLYVDFTYPVELIPGIHDVEITNASPLLQGLKRIGSLQGIRQSNLEGSERSALILLPLIWAPAVVYRYSFKAISVLYLPLIWTVHDSAADVNSLGEKVEDIVASPVERLKRWYSGFVIVALIALPALLYITLRPWLEHVLATNVPSTVEPLLSAFIFTSPKGLELAGWHIARGVNAFLTFGLYVYADRGVRAIQRGVFTATQTSATRLSVVLFVRGVLTWYVIACTVWIALHAVRWADLLPVRIRLLP